MKKSLSLIVILLLLLSGLLLPLTITHAADTPAKPAFTTLTDDDLFKLLDQMGYGPKKLSKGYLIAIKRDEWTFNIQLVLSGDGTKVGLNANLGLVENPDAVTAEKWKALMIANGDVDPSFFYYEKDQKKLYLHRVLDNRAIDAAFLRIQIDSFCTNMKNTEDLWKFTK